jgi:subtilisin family serine protease
MAMAKRSAQQSSLAFVGRKRCVLAAVLSAGWLVFLPVLLVPARGPPAASPPLVIDAGSAVRRDLPARFSFKQENYRFASAGRRDSSRFTRPKALDRQLKVAGWRKKSSSRLARNYTQRKPPLRYWHAPYRPQLRAYPRTVAGGHSQYLSSLPHRLQLPSQGQASPQTVVRQILVLIDQDYPASLGDELARTYRLEQLSSRQIALLHARAELFRVREGQSEEAVLAALQQDVRVRSAQLNRRYFHTGTTDQRYLHAGEAKRRYFAAGDRRQNAPAIPQYGPSKVGLPAAHQLALGRNVAIAVIDSNVDTGHPDLRGAVRRSFNATGRSDAAPEFHGTAVAGIIRAHGLVEGVAPQAEILAVRAFRTSDSRAPSETTTHVLVTAVDWAVKNGARILNMSFVGSRDPAIEQLLEAANQKGIVAVAAAGNGGPTAPPAYPAAYPGVIAVTAVDEADRRYEHANRGSYITVAAPGVDILAPVEHGGHAYLSGTSFAAAYVSGIAALLLERDPNLDAKALADLIRDGADDLGPVGRDDDFGAGRVNAYTSLKLIRNDLAATK